jgi:hypothetical protein
LLAGPNKDAKTRSPRRSIQHVPAVSVVMPARNAAPYVDAAVRSILDQSFRDFELIIRDDGSSDGTTALLRAWAARDPRIRLFEGDQLGLAGSSNWIVEQARAPIVARMDADDVARADRLERQLRVLRDHPSVDLVGALSDSIDSNGRKVRGIDRWRLVRRSWFPPFPHTSVMFRSAAFAAVGGYRPLAYCEDWDFFLRIANQGRIAVVADALVSHRVVATGASGAADTSAIVVGAIDEMLATLPEPGSNRPYQPAERTPLQADASRRVDPLAIVSSHSTMLWSGGSPRVLRRLLQRGRLRLDARSVNALGWALLAQLSPAMLRLALKTLLRARNLAASPQIKLGLVYEWIPGGRNRRSRSRSG